jgi:glucose-1-phosphate cytidylyltransferase
MVKVAILAGGLGTRLGEETAVKPKPMVEIGGRPMLWHIMTHYAAYGQNEFLVALGYKGEVIKDYFVNYHHRRSSLTVDLAHGEVRTHASECEDWRIHLVDTGAHVETGGRVKRLKPWIGRNTFMLTYGDGIGDIDIDALLAFHQSHGRLATVTAVRPPARFGSLDFLGDQVARFVEKPQAGEGWINGGFFVLEPEVFDYIENDSSSFERAVLEQLAGEGQLMAYRHDGFWQCMDTLRDVNYLEKLWSSGEPPWRNTVARHSAARRSALQVAAVHNAA